MTDLLQGRLPVCKVVRFSLFVFGVGAEGEVMIVMTILVRRRMASILLPPLAVEFDRSHEPIYTCQ